MLRSIVPLSFKVKPTHVKGEQFVCTRCGATAQAPYHPTPATAARPQKTLCPGDRLPS